MNGEIVTPGTKLFNLENHHLGGGVYVDNDIIYAAVVGIVKIDENDEVSVHGVHAGSAKVVPMVDSIVVGRVRLVNMRMAQIDIISVDNKSIAGSGFKGVIRKENVRDFEIDKVLMQESYRPGDIVRAKIVSLGSAKSYELSTADTSLGVLSAKSDVTQAPLVPISWDQMRCPISNVIEKRKVAKQT